MISEDERFYLPNLYTFQNGNGFYGSYQGLRFFVNPEEGDEGKMLACQVWYGEYCLAESQVVDTARFPLDAAGYADVLTWLDKQYSTYLAAAQ
ncbi:MAG: hypothetical protein LUD78_07540 [Clostridiales bacterium]|nr:hypothetical protein [Clostridiales bacterium]